MVLYLDFGCMTFTLTTQNDFTLLHHLLPMPMSIKNLSAKTTKYILICRERSVKRKSNVSFIRVIKNPSFDHEYIYG